MENKPTNKKWLIFGLAGFAVILAITAVVLFFRLNPVQEPSPSPKAKASPKTVPVQQTTTEGVCELSFSVEPSPSPSPSVSPSPSPSASPSPSPEAIACFDTCDSDTDCEDDLRCMSVGGTYRCVNPSCPEDVDCICASPNPSASPGAPASPAAAASPKAAASPVAQAQLPEAGFNAPLVLGVSAGILMMLLGLVF